MISITRVETTPDLRYTKVYVSFLQEERVKDAMAGLKSAAGYLRRQLGHNLQLRYSPEIVWSGGRFHHLRRENAEADQLPGGQTR